jgi:flagellar hook-basal body complex protein FliE
VRYANTALNSWVVAGIVSWTAGGSSKSLQHDRNINGIGMRLISEMIKRVNNMTTKTDKPQTAGSVRPKKESEEVILAEGFLYDLKEGILEDAYDEIEKAKDAAEKLAEKRILKRHAKEIAEAETELRKAKAGH